VTRSRRARISRIIWWVLPVVLAVFVLWGTVVIFQQVGHDEFLAAVQDWCERAERLPAHALEMTKPLLRAACDAYWEESLRLGEFAEANCFSTAALGEAAKSLLAQNGSEGRDETE
jgi:enoyl-CoA hydratase/carnithine racemase